MTDPSGSAPDPPAPAPDGSGAAREELGKERPGGPTPEERMDALHQALMVERLSGRAASIASARLVILLGASFLVGLVVPMVLLPLALIALVTFDMLDMNRRRALVRPTVRALVAAVGPDQTRQWVDHARASTRFTRKDPAVALSELVADQVFIPGQDCSGGHRINCPHRPLTAELPALVVARIKAHPDAGTDARA